jgi:hypothetical protein
MGDDEMNGGNPEPEAPICERGGDDTKPAVIVIQPEDIDKAIYVDAEFAGLLGGLLAHEEQSMGDLFEKSKQQIIPGVAWADSSRSGTLTLLVGHNRLLMCRKHGWPFKVVLSPYWVTDRETAVEFIEMEQSGRRNMTPEREAYRLHIAYMKSMGTRRAVYLPLR